MNNKHLLFLVGVTLIIVSSCSNFQEDFSDGVAFDITTRSMQIKESGSSYKVSLQAADSYSKLRNPGKEYNLDVYKVHSDTTLYVFNYIDGGWLVVAGDRRINPVIAESKEGKLDINDSAAYVRYIRSIGDDIARATDEWQPEESALSLWDMIAAREKRTDCNPETKSMPWKWVIRRFFIEENTTYSTVVPHLLETKWGQETPWNISLPIYGPCQFGAGAGLGYSNDHCKAGCVAVAIGQVLYYYHGHILHKPTALFENISCDPLIQSYTSNIGVQLGNRTQSSTHWSAMPLTSNGFWDDHYDYVSDFLLEIGHWCEMKYSCDHAAIPSERGSGTTMPAGSSDIWRHYDISCESDNHYSEIEIDTDLRNGNPVIISVNPQNSTADSFGHTWVIDGLQYERQDYTMVRYCEYSNEWISTDEVYDSFEDVRHRYGFSGEYDFQTYQGDPVILRNWFMNWGEDGVGDNVTYTSNPFWNNAGMGSSTYYQNVVLVCHDFE